MCCPGAGSGVITPTCRFALFRKPTVEDHLFPAEAFNESSAGDSMRCHQRSGRLYNGVCLILSNSPMSGLAATVASGACCHGRWGADP